MVSFFNVRISDHKATLRAWQVAFCDGNHCAAMLMDHFDKGHQAKLKLSKEAKKVNEPAKSQGQPYTYDESLLQLQSLNDLKQVLLGLFEHEKIQIALKLLEEKSIISKCSETKPQSGTTDHPFFYLFHPENAQEFLLNYTLSEQVHTAVRFVPPPLLDEHLIINKKLTIVQRQHVQAAFIELSSELSSYSESQAIASLEATLLDPKCFVKTGQDFAHKLNAIKQSVFRGKWSPPASLILAQQKIRADELYALERKIDEATRSIRHAEFILSNLRATTLPSFFEHWEGLKQKAEKERVTLLAECAALQQMQRDQPCQSQPNSTQTEGRIHYG